MNIYEATKQSKSTGKPMRRRNGLTTVFPTNDPWNLCIVFQSKPSHPPKLIGRWQPSQNDLLADDWIV